MNETPSCGCQSITDECSGQPNCRWLARAKAAASAAPAKRTVLPLTDVQIDELAADVAHTMPSPGAWLLTVPMLRTIIEAAALKGAELGGRQS